MKTEGLTGAPALSDEFPKKLRRPSVRRCPDAIRERNPATAVGLGVGAGGELTEIARVEPELEDAVTEGMKAFVAFWISEVGETREDPVKAHERPTHAVFPKLPR